MGAYRKGMLLSLGGIVTVQTDLHSVIPSAERTTGMNRICPEHHMKLKQIHRCPENDHIVDEFVLALETPDGWLIPEASEKPEIAATKVFELTPLPGPHVNANTVYGDSMYYCVPSNVATLQGWQVITDLVRKGKVALVSRGAIRGGANEKMWRLDTYRDCLVLRELVWPASINDAPEIVPVKVDRAIPRLVDQFVAGLLTQWEDFDRTNTMQARVEEWIKGGTLVPKPEEHHPAVEQVPVTDMLAALKAAVEANR